MIHGAMAACRGNIRRALESRSLVAYKYGLGVVSGCSRSEDYDSLGSDRRWREMSQAHIIRNKEVELRNYRRSLSSDVRPQRSIGLNRA